MVKGGRFRFTHPRLPRSRYYDSNVADGTGEALRISHEIEDEGDERMRQLLDRLNEIDIRGKKP